MTLCPSPDNSSFGSPKRPARRDGFAIGSVTRITVLALLASTTLPHMAQAQTSTWLGGTSDFAVGTNWDTSPSAPGASDTAIVNSGTATLNSAFTLDTLNITGSGKVEIIAPNGALTATTGTRVDGGELDIHNGASLGGGYLVLDNGILTNNGAITTGNVDINNGMTFTQNSLGTISGQLNVYDGILNNQGSVTTLENHSNGTVNNLSGGSITTLTNNGTVSNTGTITTLNQQSGTFTNNSGGTIGGTLTISGGTANNAGTLGTVVNQAGSTFNNTGTAGALTNNGTATNTGTLSSVNQIAGSFANNAGGNVTGTVTLSGGSMTNAGTANAVDVQSGNSFTNTGTATTVTNRAGGTFVNNGTATTVNNYGTGSNGSGGTITTLNQISGTFTNAAGGTVSGTTTVSGGTLTNAGTLGAVINQSGGTVTNTGRTGAVTNQSGATFTNSGTTGALTNAGNATNTGTIASLNNTGGTFTNSGNGTITGTVTVDGSTLINNGSSLGNIQVLNGGFLKGAGTFGTITIASGATIAPGNSIGTSRISGNLVFQSGSFYEVEIDPSGASDLITVTGGVTINGGTVTVLAASGTYQRSADYLIISSGSGVTGTFSTVTSNLAFLSPTLAYRGNNVYLHMERNDIRFESVALTPNQRSVGRALDNAAAPAGVIAAATSLSQSDARFAFEALSGDIYPSLSSILLDDSQALRNVLTSRMAGATDSPFWLEGYGAWTRRFSDGNATESTVGSGGMLAGADGEIADGWRMGAAAGYGFTRASTRAASADADIDTYSAALYLEGNLGPLSLRSGAAYSFHDIDVDRYLAFGGLAQQPQGSFDAATRQVFAELGYGIDAGEVKLEPFANLAFVDYTSDPLRETGGDAALNVSGIYDNAFYSLLGLRFSTDSTLGGMPVTFGGLVGWQHAYDAGGHVARMNFSGQPGFGIGGVPVVEDQAVAELKASVKFNPSAAVEFSWQGTFAEKAFGQRAGIRLGVSF